MTNSNRLGPWVRRFLLEHVINERNLSRGTQRSYRDTLTLLIPFVARKVRRSVDELDVIHVSANLVRMFLLHLEESRNSAISTRNQPLRPQTSRVRKGNEITFFSCSSTTQAHARTKPPRSLLGISTSHTFPAATFRG